MTTQLLRRTTCPNCWTTFVPEDVLWIAAHEDLRGDPLLGAEELNRFLPTRFDAAGNALDANGFPCQRLACPHCHLPVARVLLEIEPTFVSILGSPGCGKSFFLSALTWELRRLLPQMFALGFGDADTESNALLKQYENGLFLNPSADVPQPLRDLILKTAVAGPNLYRTVTFGTQQITYPRPLLFTLQPQGSHPALREQCHGWVLCLYDNAGESFEVGEDKTNSQVTRHLAHSRMLLFLFDPLQDVRFQRQVRTVAGNTALLAGQPNYRQEAILQEAAARVRRTLNLPQTAHHDRPLIVVCTKFDVWSGLLKHKAAEPWKVVGSRAGLDVDAIHATSQALRNLLLAVSPEIVGAAEGFSRDVTYVPVSALGKAPSGTGGHVSIRPRDIAPWRVTVPLLYGLGRCLPGVIPALKRPGARGASAPRAATPARED